MNDLSHTLKIATVWLLLGTALFVGAQHLLREREREREAARFRVHGDRIEIRRGADGHYHWRGAINGLTVEFLVDTGATRTAIPADLAKRLALPSQGQTRSQTAGGTVVGELVNADIRLDGGVQADGLPVVALPALADKPLLGMDVLGRLDWRQSGGVLVLERRATP